jgi:hypothetical protein
MLDCGYRHFLLLAGSRFAASRVQDGMNIAIVRVVDVLASDKPPVCQYMAAYNREKARVPCPR